MEAACRTVQVDRQRNALVFAAKLAKRSGLQDTAGGGLRGDHRALAAVWRLMTSGVASGVVLCAWACSLPPGIS